MKIEKYCYSEYKRLWETRQEEIRELMSEQEACFVAMPEGEWQELDEEQKDKIDSILAELLPMPDELNQVIDVEKYGDFCEIAQISAAFAEELRANLLVRTEDLTGCIIFVGEEMNFKENQKELLEKLVSMADEVHVAISVDTGECSPIDIDGLVRMEFWFDFYANKEC